MRREVVIIAILGFIHLSMDMYAEPVNNLVPNQYNRSYKRVVRSTDNYFNRSGYSFGVNAMYYFGDADNFSVPDKSVPKITTENMSVSAHFAYHQPFSTHFGMRYSGTLGWLRGGNKEAWSKIPERGKSYRLFNSFFLQPAVGVECFPINRYGLFLYAGLGVTASYIYLFDYRDEKGSPITNTPPNFGLLPMGQFSIGYSWNISPQWAINLHAMFEMGIIPDMPIANLDGWPLRRTRDLWPDGWFEFGISFTYHNDSFRDNYRRHHRH